MDLEGFIPSRQNPLNASELRSMQRAGVSTQQFRSTPKSATGASHPHFDTGQTPAPVDETGASLGTRILLAIERSDENVPYKLLPLVHKKLRKLASAKLSREKPRQTIQATVLVYEA